MFIVFRTLHLSPRLSRDRLKQFGGTIVWPEEIVFPLSGLRGRSDERKLF